MYWMAVVVVGIFCVLLYLGRKEKVGENISALLTPFYKIAMYLYNRSSCRLPRLFSASVVENDLQQLCPGETKECLKTGYYVKKGAVSLAIVLLGTLFCAAVKYSSQSGRVLGESGKIVRGEYGEEAEEIDLLAEYGKNRFRFRLQVKPLLLAQDQAEALFDDFLERLPRYILGENRDLRNVSSALILEEKYDGFPIYVEWESDRPDILGQEGFIASVGQPEEAVLRVRLSYGRYYRTEEIPVTLVPPLLTEEERLYAELQEALRDAQDSSLEQAEWALPVEWRGKAVGWKQEVEDDSMLLWAAVMTAAAAAYFIADKDLHKRLEKRKECARREYPEVVHKLALFIGAGMTVRGAFQKIAGDYEVRRQNGSRASPAYEEMLYACRELRSGVSEGASYEHFGRRTGLQEYIRLSALLMQNLKKGNKALLERLRDEADKAATEQLQQGKKLGEAAGTKLLVPMVLMLAVVMAVIMIPAFSNM